MRAKTNASKAHQTILTFHYEAGELIIGEYSALDKDEIRLNSRDADGELLTVMDRAVRKKRPSALVVAIETIHGFASSRILLSTLNMIGWLQNIPVIATSFDPRTDAQELWQSVRRRLKGNKDFVTPLTSRYVSAPHITKG